jgi:hypothetical protein
VGGRALAGAGAKRGDTIDALVMASAGRRKDAVLTCDSEDLSRLGPQFPGVRVVSL